MTDQQGSAQGQIFRVVNAPVGVYAEAGFGSARTGELAVGTEIEVEQASRRNVEGVIWWRHRQGWSPQRSVSRDQIYLARVNRKYFRVVDGPLSVRPEATTLAARIGELPIGTVVEVEPNSRAEAAGFVWWKHNTGWSAERSQDGKTVFMTPIEALTRAPVTNVTTPTPTPTGSREFVPEPIFVRLPVELRQTQWIQYFGNSRYAYNIRREGKTWYNYSQGLHGGFDFGNSLPGIPIYAGVEGVVVKLERNSSTYVPNYLMVRAGTVNQFLVIYGHIAAPNHFNPGDRITPDMIVGRIDSGGQNHLHLEVRFADTQIVNPLLLMPEVLREQITKRWSNYADHFYRDATWSQWQDPYDQPILRLCPPSNVVIIGPHGRR